jgi:hypothetical protein
VKGGECGGRVEGGEWWRVEGGGWRVEGGWWRVEGGGWRVEGGAEYEEEEKYLAGPKRPVTTNWA